MNRIFFAAALAVLCCSGCMRVQETIVEQYPKTSGIQVYTDVAGVPYEFQVSGTCQTSGEYQDFSRDRMFEKIVSKAESAGADAVLIRGMQIVPEGSRVATDGMVRTLDTTSPALENSWGAMQRDFDGGYSSINKPSYGTKVTYFRVIHADYLHFKRNDDGEFIRRDKTKKPELPQMSTSAKKEGANAAATVAKQEIREAQEQISASETSEPAN